MNFVTNISSIHDLSLAREYGVKEVLISDKMFSRFSENNFDECLELASHAKQLGLKTVFVWDIISTNNEFEKSCEIFKTLNLESFDCIRAQDAGVIHFLAEQGFKLQIILENNNHNFTAVKKWCDAFAKNLDKVILSIELPETKIVDYCQKLSVPVEILGLGPILLFYSPRKLLNGAVENEESESLYALAESEESPHKGFPVVQNTHGTFMFHIKNFFILEHYQKLAESGLHSMRIDLSDVGMEYLENIHAYLQNEIDLKTLKQNYSKDTIRGFYHVNKSDVLFKKLKNHRIQRKDESYLGEVTDVLKDEYILVTIKNHSIKVGDQVTYLNPEGKNISSKIVTIRDLNLKEVSEAKPGQIVLVNYTRKVLAKSQVYSVE